MIEILIASEEFYKYFLFTIFINIQTSRHDDFLDSVNREF